MKYRVLVLVGLLCVLGVHHTFAEDLKSAAALPRTLEELNRWYVEPATNGATYFLKAYEVLSNNAPRVRYTNESGLVNEYINWPVEISMTNAPLSRATKSSLAPYLRAVNEAWPLLEEGAKCEQSRYPVDLTEGWSVSLPHLSKIKGEVMGCCVRAISQADGRKGGDAVDSILMALAVAQSLKAEPILVAQEVREGHQRNAIGALEQTINRVSVPTAALERLQKVVNQLETEETKGEDFQRAWLGEKVIATSIVVSSNQLYEFAMELIKIHFATFTEAQIPALIAKGWQTRIADQKLLEETYDKILSLWKQDYPKRFEADEIFKSRIGEMAQRQFILSYLANFDFNLKFTDREGAAIVRLRLAKTSVALERYRAAHENQYPDALSALVPDYLSAVPVDLFADAPLKYRRRGNGYALYGVGPDRQDDGGSRKADLVFETIHPPGRAVIE